MEWAFDWSEKEKECIHNLDGKNTSTSKSEMAVGGGVGVQFDVDLRLRGCAFWWPIGQTLREVQPRPEVLAILNFRVLLP
jgi:hypothetical protein